MQTELMARPPAADISAAVLDSRVDVLSDFLSSCPVHCRNTELSALTAPWGLELKQSGPGFVIVVEGGCLLRAAGGSEDAVLRPLDLVVFTRENGVSLWDQPPSGWVPGEGPPDVATRILWGHFEGEAEAHQAFALLPAVLLVHGDAAGPAHPVQPLLRILLDELAEPQPGGAVLVDRLLGALLVIALRASPASLPTEGGLLPALVVPGMSAVLAAIHARPGQDWTVADLADIAGLSRSTFALRFLQSLGCPPFQYLRDVRLRLACRLLRESERGIKEIARKVGYATKEAFSRAFTQRIGWAPAAYRRQKRARPAGRDAAPGQE